VSPNVYLHFTPIRECAKSSAFRAISGVRARPRPEHASLKTLTLTITTLPNAAAIGLK